MLSKQSVGLVSPVSDENSNGKDIASFAFRADSFRYTKDMIMNTSNSNFMASFNTAFMDANTTDGNFNILVMPYPDWEKLKSPSIEDKDRLDASDPNQTYVGKIDPEDEFDDSKNSEFFIADKFEFNTGLRNTLVNQVNKVYSEWGMPADAESEQFYVAMKWPYSPNWLSNAPLKEGFQNQYGNLEVGLRPPGSDPADISTWGLYGTAEDYKARKVLIYSPTTNQAVCCRPAYFLWGNQQDQIYNNKDITSIDPNALDGGNGNPYIDAVVSPDAAFHLGILNTYGMERSTEGGYANYGFEMSNLSNNQIYQSYKAIAKLAMNDEDYDFYNDAEKAAKYMGTSVAPYSRSCYFTFVEDDFPLGVIPSSVIKSKYYEYEKSGQNQGWQADQNYIIGFGSPSDGVLKAKYNGGNDAGVYDNFNKNNANEMYREFGYLAEILEDPTVIVNNDAIISDIFQPMKPIKFMSQQDAAIDAVLGGNWMNWYQSILDNDLDSLSKNKLYEELDYEVNTFKDDNKGAGRKNFKDVFDETADTIVSMKARDNYDEDYNPNVNVIAGNGRTLAEAREIWDFFRVNFHDEKMVKSLFYEAFALDPEDEEELPEFIMELIIGNSDFENTTIFDRYTIKKTTYNIPKRGKQDVFEKGQDASGEFEILLGEDFIEGKTTYNIPKRGQQDVVNENLSKSIKEAINFSAGKFLDYEATFDPETGAIKSGEVPGLFQDLDYALVRKYAKLTGLLRFLIETTTDKSPEDILDEQNFTTRNLVSLQNQLNITSSTTKEEREEILSKINSPRKLYLFVIGWFRQTMWSDAYNRAWLVLRPNRRLQHYSSNPFFLGSFGNGGLEREDGKWDFSPVYKVWQAFIDPNTDYAKNPEVFKKFLVANAKEGDSATSWFSAAFEDSNDFWDRNIGIYFTAITDGLSGLLNMFKLSMAQMGYGLAEVDNLNKQANVLNKFLNDSIYYSLGNPGSLLRAVDNPFTREYGEPVVEVREPFQRIHYISSFTHILSNKIQENINDVATVVTAVSDGKYPVTVALDKAASPERQTEKTVETGLYFDNIRGSGFFGILHPVFHPFETIRGISKTAQGSPDELTARRVALSHLKENVKDIYNGELVIIGSPDIRPHDLVYLADVYERMYGIFEVEQVVHHFTPDLGFITSITPNALVTVNDPARWFMTSWLNSWMSLQTIRNDTRYLIASSNNSRTGIVTGGQVSIDSLNEALSAQMMGGIQYTHGHSALMKDVMANFTANAMPDARKALASQARDRKTSN